VIRNPQLQRLVAGGLLVTMLATSLATAAGADPRGYRRDRPTYRTRVVYRDYHPASTYVVRRSSSAGPVVAGFLGGLFLGAVLANAAPAGYAYYDPYCHERFASLSVYRAHSARFHHAGVVRVVAIDGGSCAGTYRYDERCGRYDYDREQSWQEDDDQR
jgi:hypothetical protein